MNATQLPVDTPATEGTPDTTDDIVLVPTRWVLRHADGTPVLRFKGGVSRCWSPDPPGTKPYSMERPIQIGADPYGSGRPGFFACIVIGELNCQAMNLDGTWSKYGEAFRTTGQLIAALAEHGPNGEYV